MSTTFVLAPAPAKRTEYGTAEGSDLNLNLLPFSLGSSSRPYVFSNVDISSHFQPRPAPSGIIGVEEGKSIATFRGRQLVGQQVMVPRGYKGWVLRTDSIEQARVASGMGQGNRAGAVDTATGHLNGCTAAEGSYGARGDVSTAGVEDDDDLSLKRSPRRSGITALKQRVRGAGQTALARPKRAVARIAKKRMRLDSDDEDEGEGEGESSPAPSTTTPRKRAGPPLVTPTRQSPRLARTPATKGVLPDITLHEATPLKTPLPPAPKHLKLKRAGPADFVIGQSAVAQDDDEEVAAPANGREAIKAEAEGDEHEDTDMEDASSLARSEHGSFGPSASSLSIIPSPATENDPPAFAIESAAPSPERTQDSTLR